MCPPIFIWYFEQKGVENVERFLEVNNGINLQNPTLPLPLLQAMAQKLQERNFGAEQAAQIDELQNVIKESEVK